MRICNARLESVDIRQSRSVNFSKVIDLKMLYCRNYDDGCLKTARLILHVSVICNLPVRNADIASRKCLSRTFHGRHLSRQNKGRPAINVLWDVFLAFFAAFRQVYVSHWVICVEKLFHLMGAGKTKIMKEPRIEQIYLWSACNHNKLNQDIFIRTFPSI